MSHSTADTAAGAIFAKAPVAGSVKTRLVPPLTHAEAAAVARACLLDTLRRVPAAVGAGWTLFLDGDADEGLRRSADAAVVRLLAQGDGDLGARLERAFARLRAEGAGRVVAIGTDSPTLDPARLAEAFDALRTHDAVLGPAEDGGYYLIGLSREAGDFFRETPWGTADVARVTSERAAARGMSLARLAPWYDVDDAATLRRAAREAAATGCPALAAALEPLASKLG
jgi:rSAM/selenodomain-associated transferase 1